jgi:hypothetical protein
MFKKLSLLFIVFVLLVSMITGCSSEATPNPVELVPEGANLLGQIDLSKILTDEEITELYDKASKEPDAPKTFEEALDKLKHEYDIDLMEFNTITFFGDISEFEGEESINNIAIIVEGTLDRDALLAAIEDAADEAGVELETSEYKGYAVYTVKDEEAALVFLSDKMLAFGPQVWVEDVIDVAKGDKKALSGIVLNTYNDLDEALLKVAVEIVPSGLIDTELPEMGEFPGDLSAFQDIKAVGLTLGREDVSLDFNMKLCADDSDSAEAIEQAVEGLITFIKFALAFSGDAESLEGILSILEDVDVSTKGSCVDVALKIALSEVEEWINNSISSFENEVFPELDGFGDFFGGSNAESYITDKDVVQLAAYAFYSDIHSGWWDVNGDDDRYNPATFDDNVWGDSDEDNTSISVGHYYPTTIAKVANHVLTLSTTQFDPNNPDNPRVNAGAVAATDAMIQAHSIWMGLLVNYDGVYTSPGGTTERWEISPLDGYFSLYLNGVPESTAADERYNGDPGMSIGGSYCWVVGQDGVVFGVYKAADDYWYAGFNGTYP